MTVEGDRPVALRGDPTHPYTRGALCNKVADYLAYARSPDRVLHPMRRVGPRGSNEFTRISWDEALAQRDTRLARDYPLALITPANHYFLNSIFADVPHQQRRAGPATLMIHPEDAATRGIAPGDEVQVGNARGAFFAVADVTDRVRPGVVASTKGRWPADARRGATANATVDERDSDMGGGAVYHDNRVQVERAGAAEAG